MDTQQPSNAINDISTPARWQPPADSGRPSAAGDYPFHRLLLASPNYRIWKPLVAVPLMFIVYLPLGLIVSLAMMGTTGPSALNNIDSPAKAALLLSNVLILLPSLLAAFAIVRLPIKTLFSVAKGMRWTWLGWTVLPALIILVPVMLATTALTDGLHSSGGQSPFTSSAGALAGTILILVVLLPLQCLTEELVFRGFLVQMFGSWVSASAFSIISSSLIFMIMHGYSGWSMASIFIMAAISAVLTIRTGGIEASLSMHVANNVFAFALALATTGGVPTTGDLGAIPTLLSSAGLVVYALAIEFLMRKKRHGAKPLATTLSVPLQFPNREGDPHPADFGVSWQGKTWVVDDQQLFSEALQNYVHFGTPHSPGQQFVPQDAASSPHDIGRSAAPLHKLNSSSTSDPTIDDMLGTIGEQSQPLTDPPSGSASSPSDTTYSG